MFLSYVSRTAPTVALVVLGVRLSAAVDLVAPASPPTRGHPAHRPISRAAVRRLERESCRGAQAAARAAT